MVTFFYYKDGHHNAGDCLMPQLAGFLYRQAELTTDPDEQGKVVGIGSIIQHAVRPGDTVWGTGLLTPGCIDMSNVDVLAVRGPLTAEHLGLGTTAYGDPGLLMSLAYPGPLPPERRTLTAYLPHYVDYEAAKQAGNPEGYPVLNIRNEWTQLVDFMANCQRIITTSLHGIVLAESYKVPEVVWDLSYTGRVVGGTFKFDDYFAGTGRPHQQPGLIEPMSPSKLADVRSNLLVALRQKYPLR